MSDVDKAVDILENNLGIMDYKVSDDSTIHISQNLELAGTINTELAKNSVIVFSSSIVGTDLEDYFMGLMEQSN